ncbi:MAG: precorrin-6A reductase [Ruminococcus sp.]|nr:precorrin-6A reductase [Ruminococcus sp.]
MTKTLIFGGTTEGRLLAEFCAENGISCTVSVATEYGKELLPRSGYVDVAVGKKDGGEMTEYIFQNGFRRVIDAAHPYALEARKNIRLACEKTGAEYIRVVREKPRDIPNALYFGSCAEAAGYLKEKRGRIFIATGSKDLAPFLSDGFPERCAVRVIPSEDTVSMCKKAGFFRVIALKGPFTYESNMEHFKGCGYVLTKESGRAGGFEEKRRAAEDTGAQLIIIRRAEEEGVGTDGAREILLKGKISV